MCRLIVLGEIKFLFLVMLFDIEDKKDKIDDESNGNSIGDEDVNG